MSEGGFAPYCSTRPEFFGEIEGRINTEPSTPPIRACMVDAETGAAMEVFLNGHPAQFPSDLVIVHLPSGWYLARNASHPMQSLLTLLESMRQGSCLTSSHFHKLLEEFGMSFTEVFKRDPIEMTALLQKMAMADITYRKTSSGPDKLAIQQWTQWRDEMNMYSGAEVIQQQFILSIINDCLERIC